LDGVGPDSLRVSSLVARAEAAEVTEVILALPATVDGQTTAHYLAERLAPCGVTISMIARGVPVGGELDWLDDGTIAQALRARRPA
uniref:toprim domain-containing protein n=1 Tax=Phenylobacterium sp. TaxID=1871053 RepID=UPI002601BAC4